MSELVKTNPVKDLSSFLNSDGIKNKFIEILGNKGVGFISSVLSTVNSNNALINADKNSIYTAALLAASLDLPINQNLGLAYILPYNVKQADGTWKQMAQFQLGYKGFKQLAQRTGQFVYLHADSVKEGELLTRNRLTGQIEFNWIQDEELRTKTKTIGYVSYFELVNGFKSTLYMTIGEMENHAKKYSQTYKKGFGLWKDEFDMMSIKTVTKLNLSKNAPLSIEMQRATLADQSVIKNDNFTSQEMIDIETNYVDNEEAILDIEEVNKNKERLRIKEWIENSKTIIELEKCESGISIEDLDLAIMYDERKKELTPKK
jgi:recombination protein RecT